MKFFRIFFALATLATLGFSAATPPAPTLDNRNAITFKTFQDSVQALTSKLRDFNSHLEAINDSNCQALGSITGAAADLCLLTVTLANNTHDLAPYGDNAASVVFEFSNLTEAIVESMNKLKLKISVVEACGGMPPLHFILSAEQILVLAAFDKGLENTYLNDFLLLTQKKEQVNHAFASTLGVPP